MSNQFAKNYQNLNVQSLLSNMTSDIQLNTTLSVKDKSEFVKTIKDVKEGKEWEETQKYAEKLQPPIFDRNCK